MFLFEKIRRRLLYIIRWNRIHGFGVQSPFAFNFIKNVAYETHPYYAYSDLIKQFGIKSLHRQALMQFYLRLSNKLQNKDWLVMQPEKEIDSYIKAGCLSSSVVGSGNADIIVYNSPFNNKVSTASDLLKLVNKDGVIIIEDIHVNDSNSSLWNGILNDKRCSVSFDLYDCGIAFLDSNHSGNSYKALLSVVI